MKRMTNDELNASLNSIKAHLSPGAIVALFVFQETDRGVATDFVTNADTKSLAHTLRDWARRIINGDIHVSRDPHGGRNH